MVNFIFIIDIGLDKTQFGGTKEEGAETTNTNLEFIGLE